MSLFGAYLLCAGSSGAQQVSASELPVPAAVVALVTAGDFAAAETHLRTLLRATPGAAPANFMLGYVLYRERRYTDSLACYTEGARYRTPAPDDLVIVASDYIQLRSYDDAERWLNYVTVQAPADAKAWYLLGRTEYLLDHPDRALAAFTQCLRFTPRDLPAKYNAGLALERLQRPAEAEAAYRAAITWANEQHSPDPQPWLDLGTLLLAQGQSQQAVDTLEVAAAKAPSNALCLQQLGTALEAVGRYTDAVTALRRAVNLAPNAERAHFYLARAYKVMGRKVDADAEFAMVARLYNTHAGTETPNPGASAPSKVAEETPKKD